MEWALGRWLMSSAEFLGHMGRIETMNMETLLKGKVEKVEGLRNTLG